MKNLYVKKRNHGGFGSKQDFFFLSNFDSIPLSRMKPRSYFVHSLNVYQCVFNIIILIIIIDYYYYFMDVIEIALSHVLYCSRRQASRV